MTMKDSPVRFLCTLIAYVVPAAMIIGSLIYDELHVHDPKAKHPFAGKWKYLTHWTLWVQAIYWCLAIFAGLSTNSYDKRDRLLHRVVDLFHASVAFPLGMIVCILFWAIYAVDRELVFPKRYDEFVPVWLNHVMHTSYIPLLLMDKYLVLHRYPKKSHGIALLLIAPIIYQTWLLYLAFAKNIWVYPVLAVMNWPFRIVFFFFSWISFVVLYNIGASLTNQIWGGHKVVQKQKIG